MNHRPEPLPPLVRPTAQGWVMAICGGLALSALLWPQRPFVFALGVAFLLAIALAMFMVPWYLRRIHADWLLPGPVHAGEEVTLGARISADRPAPPCTLGAWNPAAGRFEFVTDLAGVGTAPTRVAWSTRFPRRGVIDLPPLAIRNEQPFGMLWAQRSAGPGGQIVVRPALGRVRQSLVFKLRQWLDEGGITPDPGDDDISHLRAYRPGDPMRRVNWRASARARQLLVTQRQAPASQHLTIAIDTDIRRRRSRRFERLICAAATLVDHLSREGWRLSLCGPFVTSGEGSLYGDRDHLLDALAEIEPTPGESVARCLPRKQACLLLCLSSSTDDPPAGSRVLRLTLDDLAEHLTLPRVEA